VISFVVGVSVTRRTPNEEIITMAQYLLSVWHDEEYVVEFSSEHARKLVGQVGAFNEALQQSGSWVFAAGLNPASSSTTVRPAGDGGVTVTDGPYAESKEQIGGFWIIEAADGDAAMEWARKASLACEGPVELRPFQTEMPE
jgi:hypothetical protein